jgi:Plavaka transposase
MWQLSANFNEYLKVRGKGKMPTASFMAYCQREMFHQQWKLILSDELVQAMEHGFKLTCLDGIERRFFPRVFTYSADYPEK